MYDGKNFSCDYCKKIFDMKEHPFLTGLAKGNRWNGKKLLTGIFCNEEHKKLYEEQFKVEDNVYKIGDLYCPYFGSEYGFETIEGCRNRNKGKVSFINMNTFRFF